MANARSTSRTTAGKTQRTTSGTGQTSRATSRTGAWGQVKDQVKQHPILAVAGVLAMGVGAYALLRKNGHHGRRGSNA